MLNRKIRDFAKLVLKGIYNIEYPFFKVIGHKPQANSQIINMIKDKEQQLPSINTTNNINEQVDLMIIVAAYNCDTTIKKCIDSVLTQQTKYSYQLVIVNDGSTDKTKEILNNYINNPQIKIINQTNRGFSGARNTALKNITGKYIFFLDADDFVPSKKAFDQLMNVAYQNDADIVEGAAFSFFYDNNKIKINRNMKHQYNGKVKQDTDMCGYPWGKVYKNQLFKYFKFPEKLWFEDTLISMLLYSMTNNKYIINDIVYAYQVNPKGISHSFAGNNKTLDTFLVTKLLVDEQVKLNLINEQTQDIFLNQMAMNYSRLKSLSNEINDAVLILSSIIYKNTYSKLSYAQLSYKEKALKKELNDKNLRAANATLKCWNYLK